MGFFGSRWPRAGSDASLDNDGAEIRQAVETLFKTKVLDVKTMNVKGKTRRMGRNIGKRADWKKAIVRLAPGENIEFFEGM